MIFLEMLVDVNNRDIAGTQIPDAHASLLNE